MISRSMPVGALAEVLEKEDRPVEIGQVRRSDQPGEQLEIASQERSARPPRNDLLEAVEEQRRARDSPAARKSER